MACRIATRSTDFRFGFETPVARPDGTGVAIGHGEKEAMSIRVELTYDMSKVLGVRRFELDGASTVREVVAQTAARFDGGDDFEKLARLAAVAVNGVLVNHRKGMKTRLVDGDRVGFVKAAAGG